MQIEQWFPVPIWFDDVSLDFEKVKSKCLDLRNNNHPNRIISNRGGWQSHDLRLNDHQEFNEVSDVINNKIAEFNNSINPQFKSRLDNCWININDRNNFNTSHIHPFALFSGVLYIAADENAGDLVFYNTFHPWKYSPIENYGSQLFHSRVTYKPRTGMLVIFPAWLEHSVDPSNSDNNRISIAFNIQQVL